jgi:hypothetical protein
MTLYDKVNIFIVIKHADILFCPSLQGRFSFALPKSRYWEGKIEFLMYILSNEHLKGIFHEAT